MSDQQDTQRKPLRLTALSPADLARVLSSASGRLITEEQIRKVVEGRDIIKPDGTINLIEYTAALAHEV